MRVYVMTDLEGISGVVDIAYMDMAKDFYRTARELLTAEVNAAAAACFDAGATEVAVRDGHHTGCNFITQQLDRRIVLDKAPTHWTASLDATFDATVLIGAHAMAGTLGGFLDHTMSSTEWFAYSINGRPLGEIGMWATMAGHFKVPLVYVAGDRAACDEAAALLKGVATTAVKRGAGRNRATGLHPDAAHEAIRADLAGALAAGPKVWPRPLVWRKPLTVRLTFCRSDMADDRVARSGDLKRVDARTVERRTSSQLEIVL